MRVLVVTNFEPDDAAPQRGRWVRDQVDEVRRRGIEVDVFSFPPGRGEYAPATRRLRALLRRRRFDLVHAHYGLPGWCALLAGARPLIVTFHGTDVRHRIVGPLSRRLAPRLDLVAGASRALFAPEGGRAGLSRREGASAVLPCGADFASFKPASRHDARARLGLSPEGRYLLFPASISRPVKRHDRAVEVARLADAELLCGGAIEPGGMVDWINASNAVLVTSDNEGFGLAAVEALGCDVPVLSTPVGIAPTLLRDVEGCLVEPFDAPRWAALARAHLDDADPRVEGRERARWLSVEPMAERVVVAYRELLADRPAL
ncbi:MAG: glycosyltransferase [Solirubrobacterales bacterium]